jgi:hypothetical protein
MRRFVPIIGLMLLTAGTAAAQTKVSGTALFAKPDPQTIVATGDGAGHSLGVGQRKCTWTTAMEVGGEKSKEGMSTATMDIKGDTARTHGYHVTTTDAGDKYFVSFQGTAVLKDGAETSEKGTWSFTGGTGKLKGIAGKGTYTCAPSGDGMSCDIEGEATTK